MQTELRWVASMSASCFYATRAIIRGEIPPGHNMTERLGEPAHRLSAEIQGNKIDRERFLDHVTALSADIENNSQLAEVALTKTVGVHGFDATLALSLARHFSELESAFNLFFPNGAEELATRGEPLRQQWEAKGDGLLREIGRLTHPNIIAERANVVLIYPTLGGGGKADLPYNSVRIEAMLADPHPELPEVVRLGWLISQLNLDVPVFCERIPGKRLPRAAGLAMVPATLAAAEELQLAKLDLATLELALTAWRLETAMRGEIAETLLSWWETYQTKKSRLALALTALDRMLD